MKKIYVVHDSKTGSYGSLMVLVSKGSALRSFMEEVNRPESLVHKYAEDFTLFEIGTYNELDGIIKCYDAKVSLGCAIDFKKGPVQQEIPEIGKKDSLC